MSRGPCLPASQFCPLCRICAIHIEMSLVLRKTTHNSTNGFDFSLLFVYAIVFHQKHSLVHFDVIGFRAWWYGMWWSGKSDHTPWNQHYRHAEKGYVYNSAYCKIYDVDDCSLSSFFFLFFICMKTFIGSLHSCAKIIATEFIIQFYMW